MIYFVIFPSNLNLQICVMEIINKVFLSSFIGTFIQRLCLWSVDKTAIHNRSHVQTWIYNKDFEGKMEDCNVYTCMSTHHF